MQSLVKTCRSGCSSGQHCSGAWRRLAALAQPLIASLAGGHGDPVGHVRQQLEQDPEFCRAGGPTLQAALRTFWGLTAHPSVDSLHAFMHTQLGIPPPGPPFTAEQQQQLAVRCAQALGTRTCANLRCASLTGASEAASRGRKCGGCRAVRYCSEACSRADWKQHRVACRLLQQEAGCA
jgi:hypothetical protein